MIATIPKRVNLAIPTHDDRMSVGTTMSIVKALQTKSYHITIDSAASSLLPYGFNVLWCGALNRINTGLSPCDYFVMLHSDIAALQPDWLDRLIGILEDNDADIVSVISPIKDSRGVTSSGYDDSDRTPTRFTMNQLFTLPETMTSDYVKENFGHNLLFNTGLMAVRMSADWIKDVCFDFRSYVDVDDDGWLSPYTESEDWRFARYCAELGIKSCVTRAIGIKHFGVVGFGNDQPWGAWQTDETSKL